ncbi:MAM and LDL-receptor class A domain-containing protein 1-like [Aplysia californica]|uniref:MAM and LDL-receptor class A domain-containing protein 1-like n=1 Tax=Aplysia californica TaxID=6500 RepID=A0ABM0K3M6_APLCA|nr:MAM and LDL-receptor class A domain-containing protein 1-like [Aplysia californica]
MVKVNDISIISLTRCHFYEGPEISLSSTNTTSLDCDFQTDICNWTQAKDDQADWRRRQGETNSYGTGPFYDHTYRNFTGVYIYFEGGDVRRANDTASLQSPLLPAQTGAIFSFFYHMRGYQMGTLRIRLVTYDLFGSETSEKILFQKYGKEQTMWTEARIDVNETESFRLFVEALLLHDFDDYTDMAVDDFRFFRTCKSNPCGTDQTCTDRQFGFACTSNCTTAQCLNGGMCQADGESYTCRCAPGYTGPNCETDIDDCQLLPCQNKAVCVDLVNSYFCACADGFAGTNCEIQLETPECHGLVVDLHATPQTLTPPITAELNITCSLRKATSDEKRVCGDVISSDFGGVASVTLTRKGSGDVIEETVSVMSLFGNATAKADHGMLEVQGRLTQMMTSPSPAIASLDNRWFYPTEDQAGNYSCTIVAIGSMGRPLTFQARKKIEASIPAKQEVRKYVINLHNNSCPK